MLRLREHYAVDLQVSLLEEEEFDELGLNGFEGQSQRRGISLIKFPIRDVSVPTSMKSFAKVIREIVRQLNDGKRVVVHCKGGLGRTGLTAACAIVAVSRNHINSSEAIKMVRQVRPGAVETSQQENFVALFEEYWQIYSERIESLLYQQKTAVSEKILEIKSKGLIERLFRFPSYDGRYFFYLTVEYPHSPNNDNYDWKAEPVPTFREALELLSNHYQFIPYKTPFIHPEYQTEFKSFLEKIIEDVSGSFTFEQWLTGEDDPAEWEHTVNNSNHNNEEQKSVIESDSSESPRELSNKHFLIYWQERNVLAHGVTGSPLDVVSSHQLKRVKAGDTLWLVTINQAGELILAGGLKIGEIVDYKTAVERLNDSSLWDGGFYALPQEDEAEYLRPTNLGEAAAFDLRFANTASDRLALKNGKINPQQLQTMRELTEDSAEMLARIWETEEKEENNDDFEDGDSDVKYFRQRVREQPLTPGFHYKLGFHCDIQGLTEEANAAYRKVIELAPNALPAYENLGRSYLRAGELDKARAVLEDAVRLYPKSASERFLLGMVYAAMGDYEKAIAVTNKGLEFDLNDPMAYFNLGNFYFHLQNYEKAVYWLEKSAEINEYVDPQTFYWLGKSCRHLGEKQKEFDAYRKAVENDPDFLDARFALGTVCAHLTETAEGRQVTYFEIGADKIEIKYIRFFYFYMGLADLALGNLDEARQRQAELRGVDASFRPEQGDWLPDQLQFFIDRFEEESHQVGREDEGENLAELLESLRRLVRQEPHNPDAHYNLGIAFDQNDFPEEANAAYQKAIELDPSYWQAHYNLGQNY